MKISKFEIKYQDKIEETERRRKIDFFFQNRDFFLDYSGILFSRRRLIEHLCVNDAFIFVRSHFSSRVRERVIWPWMYIHMCNAISHAFWNARLFAMHTCIRISQRTRVKWTHVSCKSQRDLCTYVYLCIYTCTTRFIVIRRC